MSSPMNAQALHMSRQSLQGRNQGSVKVSRMTLANVKTGIIAAPLRVVLYGPEGVGKTTFAAGSNSPIFLCAEDGTNEHDVARLRPHTWDEVFEAVAMLAGEQHSYRTLVIDTLDWIEQLCWQQLCKRDKKDSIEAYGYGRGYVIAHEEFRRLIAALDRLREKTGMTIVCLAHSWIKSFKNPDGEDYDRFELKLQRLVAPVFKEWSDLLLFANYETFTRENDKKRVVGVSTGARYIFTQRTAAFDAKNRHSLPVALALSWEDLTEAIIDGQPASAKSLQAQIDSLVPQLVDPALAELVRNTAAKAVGDGAMLAKILSRLEARIHLQQQTEDTAK
jgi:hypothetical protein